MYMYIYMYTYTYMYIHVYIYTYIYQVSSTCLCCYIHVSFDTLYLWYDMIRPERHGWQRATACPICTGHFLK